jgi:hypothetical protein
MTISPALLAPGLVRAAIEGRLPHGIGFKRFRDARQNTASSSKRSVCDSPGPGAGICGLGGVDGGVRSHMRTGLRLQNGVLRELTGQICEFRPFLKAAG